MQNRATSASCCEQGKGKNPADENWLANRAAGAALSGKLYLAATSLSVGS